MLRNVSCWRSNSFESLNDSFAGLHHRNGKMIVTMDFHDYDVTICDCLWCDHSPQSDTRDELAGHCDVMWPNPIAIPDIYIIFLNYFSIWRYVAFAIDHSLKLGHQAGTSRMYMKIYIQLFKEAVQKCNEFIYYNTFQHLHLILLLLHGTRQATQPDATHVSCKSYTSKTMIS